jgi:uncharacterized protein (TIGR01777 family)
MRIIVSGGSGFLGRGLCEIYAEEGHEVLVLTRGLQAGAKRHEPGTGVPGVSYLGWVPDGTAPPAASPGSWTAYVDDADAVINLSGESIGARRWTDAQKKRIIDSRLLATRSLAAAIRAVATPPRVLVSGSAVGYYGLAGAEPKTEQSPPGDDFLARLCVDWEAEARQAARPGMRVATIRTGIALDRGGGVLQRMLLPFRMGVGGPLGSGRQFMSWIHRNDWIEMVRWIVSTGAVSGAVNVTSPYPVTNKGFVKALGRALRRPAIFPVPGFVLRAAFGEMAESLLLGGQKVLPTHALELGFHFRYPEIDRALESILRPQ